VTKVMVDMANTEARAAKGLLLMFLDSLRELEGTREAVTLAVAGKALK